MVLQIFSDSRSYADLLIDLSGAQADLISTGAEFLRCRSKQSGTDIRIYSPSPVVAFGGRDTKRPGFSAAERVALEAGFSPVVRGPGGHAVAYHQRSLCVEVFGSTQIKAQGVSQRYEALNHIWLSVLSEYGVEAREGEIPREFCPGRNSIVCGGIKVIGSAQRVSGDKWMWGSGVIVADSQPIREVLTEIYSHLELDLEPSTIGSLQDLGIETTTLDLTQRILNVMGDFEDVQPRVLGKIA